ncbi:hypothetical protein PVAND_017532 [Polypedilum vanderplanki]|uniref:Uncharacterized protein n=1 Tax=Polypedilum vanderplanki TaxID=319348 RepID=A0A9J6BIY9_POLVA|nr:hypothetical protein PVAND_017532 [Polypedilum vanderplanki]
MVDFPKIPTVSNFFHFFNLITGNIIVGWIHFSLSILIVTAYILFLVFNHGTTHLKEGDIEADINIKPGGFTGTVLIIICLILLVVAVFMAFISFWFIRGIKTCDPSKMKPYLLFSVTFVILAFITTLYTLYFFLLVITLIELYFFICAYSLYVNFVSQTCGIADVVYQNPKGYGYTQAYENDDYSEENDSYQQQQYSQQTYGNFDQQQPKQDFYADGQQHQQQQQYYGQ